MSGKSNKGFGSICVSTATQSKKVISHNEPIYATTGYGFDDLKKAHAVFDDPASGFTYSRWGNPTVDMAAQKIAQLECHGSDLRATGLMFSSGMAAIASVITACVQRGDAILTQAQLYGTTDELLMSEIVPQGVRILRNAMQDMHAVEKILKQNKRIKLIYLETPSNPLLAVTDIAAMAQLASKYGCKVAVDNTFASPYCQRPLLLGADIVIHSATKYLNGHGNGLGGVVVSTDKQWVQGTLWKKIKLLGASSNAFESWLILQGMKTLEVRMQRHCDNAAALANWLVVHQKVKQVFYCGLPAHPQFAVIQKQMYDHTGMLSFELKGGLRAGKKLLDQVRFCRMVTTLGTVDTLIQHPASMTHVNVPRERRIAAGLSDGLIRMSVGIENIEDIFNDLEAALKKV